MRSIKSFPQPCERILAACKRPCVFVWIALIVFPNLSAARQGVHLNPAIAKLEAGEIVYGLSTQDLSLSHARDVARAPADFMYVDMEHSPMDFAALRMFLLAMGDKQTILSKGNAQPDVALLARFAPPPETNPNGSSSRLWTWACTESYSTVSTHPNKRRLP